MMSAFLPTALLLHLLVIGPVIYPSYKEFRSEKAKPLKIVSVHVYPKMTKFILEYTASERRETMSTPSRYHMVFSHAGKKWSSFQLNDSNPDKETITMKAGETVDFVLEFGPLPEGADSLELIGGHRRCNFAEIDLSHGNTAETQQIGKFDLDDIFKAPLFKGGNPNTFSVWVNKHLVYPEVCKSFGQQGTVHLLLHVLEDGQMIPELDVSSGTRELDNEALRVVSLSPRWTPATMHGFPVNYTFGFPIIFALQ